MSSFASLKGLSPEALRDLLSEEDVLSAEGDGFQSETLGQIADLFAGVGQSENIFGTFPLPYSAVRMRVNGRERIVPIATEEAGIAAGMSKAAKLVRPDGFAVEVWDKAVICGEALLVDVPEIPADVWRVKMDEILFRLFRDFGRTDAHPRGLIAMDPPVPVAKDWPGARTLRFRIDPGDAMGAKMAIRIAETGARAFVEAFGGRVVTAIITNQSSGWSASATYHWPIPDDPKAQARAEAVLDLCRWAAAVPSRAVTHNKGVLNGIIAAATAFGQDTRAIEASIASVAYVSDTCKPLTQFSIKDGALVGRLDRLRIPIGTVGGSMKHPMIPVSMRLAGIEGTADLAAVLTASGLAANFASLFQLASPEGFSDTYRHL